MSAPTRFLGDRVRTRSRGPGLLRRSLRSSAERSVYDVLRYSHLAARPFRAGLGPRPATQSARAMRQLLDVEAVAVIDTEVVLAYAGSGSKRHQDAPRLFRLASLAMESGRAQSGPPGWICGESECSLGETLAVPLRVGNDSVGAIFLGRGEGREISLGLARATREMGRLIGVQLALAEQDATRQELTRARTVAMRAQISPHFAYNTLTAAASLVRRDPDRARELLVQFADFSRYILRNDRVNTPLSDELRNVHNYLDLERMRHPDRLEVVFRIDPGVLHVLVPVLILQPLVENAVQHGIEESGEGGKVTIIAEDRDEDVFVAVSDTGVGLDDEVVSGLLGESPPSGDDGHFGIRSVNERLRTTYGDRYRLSLSSAPGEGLIASFCVPKYRAGVTA
ncbi:MAG: sensor histidine kinase [Acidimicrobiia bacterium]|nr:sensor histidine kinase [Acidimicrobiia bacterium]